MGWRVFWAWYCLTIPLYRHHQHFVAVHSLNSGDVAFVDQMHRLLSARFLWFQLDKKDSPVCMDNFRLVLFIYWTIFLLNRQHINWYCHFIDKYAQKLVTCPSESTCQAVKHGVHSKWPHGSILISLSFSAHILHNWNVLPENAIQKNQI